MQDITFKFLETYFEAPTIKALVDDQLLGLEFFPTADLYMVTLVYANFLVSLEPQHFGAKVEHDVLTILISDLGLVKEGTATVRHPIYKKVARPCYTIQIKEDYVAGQPTKLATLRHEYEAEKTRRKLRLLAA